MEATEEKPVSNPRANLVKFFEGMNAVDAAQRNKCATAIVERLCNHPQEVEEDKYALMRLVRGLGAANLRARGSYYTALVVLLAHPQRIDADDVVDAGDKELHVTGQDSKSEKADCHAGRLLLASALLRSGRFEQLTDDRKTKLMAMVVESAAKRAYLITLASALLADALPKLPEKVYRKWLKPALQPQFDMPLGDMTIDQLYLLLAAQELFPGKKNKDKAGVVVEANVSTLVRVLLRVPPATQVATHRIYPFIAPLIVRSGCLPTWWAAIEADFDEEYTVLKHQAVGVLSAHIVANLTDCTTLPQVFGGRYLSETLNHFKKTRAPQDFIRSSFGGLLRAVEKALTSQTVDSRVKVDTIQRLLFYPGVFIFEKLTGSKVIQQITASMDAPGVHLLAEMYKGVFMATTPKKKNDKEYEHWLNLDRVYAGQLFGKLINHPVCKTDDAWRAEALDCLMRAALFQQKTIGVDLAKSLRDAFFTALNTKSTTMADVTSLQLRLVRTIDGEMSSLRSGLDGEALEAWKRMLAIVDRMHAKSKKLSDLSRVFETLLVQMALQLFADSKLACASLKELFECYERRKSDTVDVPWIEVVVDLFLNLLSHPSHLLRRVVCMVFPYLCQHMTASGVHQILHVLDPKSEENPLSTNSDDDDDDEEDEDDEEDDDEKEEEEEVSDEEEEEEETPNDQLRQALQDVFLKSRTAMEDDAESVDLDAISDTEGEALNKALGAAFAQFKPQTQRKSKKQARDAETLTHFRVRALDLIDIYLDSKCAPMLICLEIMLPLLQTLEFSIRDAHQKPLQDRLNATLRKLTSLKHFANHEEVDEALLARLLESILERGTKGALMCQEMSNKISDACVFVTLCGNIVTGGEYSKKSPIATLMVGQLNTFFVKRDCMTPYGLFKSLVSKHWVHAIHLIGALIRHAFDADVRPFRRRQALELLRIFYANHHLLKTHEKKYAKLMARNEETLGGLVLEFFRTKNYKVKEVFLVGIMLLVCAVKAVKTAASDETFDWRLVGELAREYRTGLGLSRHAKTAFNKMCNALGVSPDVAMKQDLLKLNTTDKEEKEEEDGEVDEEEPEENGGKKEKKKKKGKEAKRMKKETRALRMQSLSEGMSTGFADADMDAMDARMEVDEEVEDEEQPHHEEKEKRKKKKKKKSPKRERKTSTASNGDEINGVTAKKKRKK